MWLHGSIILFFFFYCWVFHYMAIPQFQFPIHQYKYLCIVPIFQFSSLAQSCPTLGDPMDHSTPGLPVHYQLPEFTQTHVHWVSDAIQPSHPLSSPSPPAFNLSQHQSLFKQVSSSPQVAKVLEIINKVAINMHVQIFLCVNINFYS